MCTTCGCGSGETRIGALGGGRPAGGAHPRPGATRTWRAVGGHAAPPPRGLSPDTSSSSPVTAADTTPTSHPAAPGHHHLDFGSGPAHAHAPGLSQAQMVKIERDILGKNDARAAENRAWLAARGIFALNLVSSPGSGKTSLLVRTLQLLGGRVPAAVIEGDQQTEFDAERIRATGVTALQINTGKGCHLDGHMVGHALERLKPADESLFLIENVGNLVCPAAFDLGEQHKVAILSVTEGEDKPLKYPDMFRAADVLLLNKCDLLPYLEFDADLAEANARRVNPKLTIFRVSATSGAGLPAWVAWIEAGLQAQRARRTETVDGLRKRVAELERQLAAR